MAVALIEYDPLEALVGEVTVRLAELLPPGDKETPELLHIPTQPLGRLAFKLKLEVVQAELSLSVTLTEKATGVPGVTDWLCEGEMVTVGLAREHVAVPPATTYVAEDVPV